MNDRRFNWPLWAGLVLSVVAVVSYAFFFYRFPITRDVPWVSYILLVAAIALLIAGVRRAPGRKIVAIIVAVIGVGLAVLFVVGTTVLSRVPTGPNVPAVGAKAPDFTLPDASGKPVALAQLLAEPGAKGVLLIFYRGYW
jgi:disulfide bond formation protein DsbB